MTFIYVQLVFDIDCQKEKGAIMHKNNSPTEFPLSVMIFMLFIEFLTAYI